MRFRPTLLAVLAATVLTGLAIAAPASAALSLTQVGGTTFTKPIYVTAPPGDSSRIFVVERGGTIRVVRNGVTLAQPFLTVPKVSTGGEGGLLSMAFAPDYATSRRFYVYYTRASETCDPGCPIVVDEFKRSKHSQNRASVGSQRRVIKVPHPTYQNHYGGQIQFGPDGFLYAATGDGGGGADPDDNAQDNDSLLGKMLRIDPRRTDGSPYGIPASNPFVGTAGRDEIWAYGLRNAFRFSFDRTTGDLLIGDVGQGAHEEIDFVAAGQGAGANFGWDRCEGNFEYGTQDPCSLSNSPRYIGPIFTYERPSGTCASITGGFVSRDKRVAETKGRYVYGDFCTGEIRSLAVPSGDDDAATGLSADAFDLYSFGEDAECRLYVADEDGKVSRIDSTMPTGETGCATAD